MGASRELRAGPLSLLLEEGGLRYVRAGRLEILRRVYAAVRDRHWDTVTPAFSNLRVDADARSFRATFDAECRRGPVDFAWTGTVTGTADGTLTFAFDGAARSSFLRNRIGICVLHPARGCAGRPGTVEHPDGSVERTRFPEDIAPHQPFKAVRAISHEVAPGVTAEARFQGDLFETEDQRNWTDASFKTYSTPLELPFPVEISGGTRVSQSVTLTIRGPLPPSPETDEPLVFRAGAAPAGTLPRLGLVLSGPRTGAIEDVRLHALRLSHLRVDLGPSDDPDALLRPAAARARALGSALEIAIHPESDLKRLRRATDDLQAPVSAFLLLGGHPGTARPILRPVAPVGAGTDAYFAELNRQRPPAEAADFLCYSVNPQVHASDNLTLMENLEAQGDTVRSARSFPGGRPAAVTPVTLKPRFNPDATAETAPPPPDARQQTLFGAAWTAGSLKHLSEAGAASVTYFETHGPRGILEGERVFPLYHVLADAAEFIGADVLPSSSSHPLILDGLTLRRGSRTRILVANLTDRPQVATLENLPARVRAHRLNRTTEAMAATDPERFRARRGEPHEAPDGRLEVELLPFEVLRIDSA
jgi:hypothetical protein